VLLVQKNGQYMTSDLHFLLGFEGIASETLLDLLKSNI
jgi:hypothetical protein